MNNELQWYSDTDENGNTRWVAPSCWHDEGSAFEWRLQQEYFDDAVHWVEAHDAELLDGDPDVWSDLGEAKAAIQKKHDEHCAVAKADAAMSG